ncbi:MAG: hypothetical protein MJZ79_06300 [Paludibacteraceae bacterium]|nr:hypothetical protein [Paludibacteraceae bacterium]
MKKHFLLPLCLVAIILSSCAPELAIVPKAVNTVNTVGLNELNLDRKDYKILKTVSSEAVVTYEQRGDKYYVREANGECELSFVYDRKAKEWEYDEFKGIARYGFLSNDYGVIESVKNMSPESYARNLAVYRLINQCKLYGGDGLIEPIISMNVGQQGRAIVFTVSASAKLVKLNTDK